MTQHSLKTQSVVPSVSESVEMQIIVTLSKQDYEATIKVNFEKSLVEKVLTLACVAR